MPELHVLFGSYDRVCRSMFVVSERSVDVYQGCYSGVCLSVFVVRDRAMNVHRGCYNGVCLCVCCNGQSYERSPWVLQGCVSVL